MTFYFGAILILTISFVIETEAECPQYIPVEKCTCYRFFDHVKNEFSTLTCKNLSSEDELKMAVQSTKGYHMYEIEILESAFQFIPHDTFIDTTYEVISIRNSSINYISETNFAFEGLENTIHLIEIIGTKYTINWSWSQFSNLISLRQVHISDSELINPTSGISRIQHIDMEGIVFENNHINHIDDGAFAPFTNLHRVVLDNNYISELKRSMFPRPAKSLTIIGFNYNRLIDLPEDLFVDMPALQTLYFTGNPFHTVPETVFKPVWKQLNKFLFANTNLICDCKLAWLINEDNSKKLLEAECKGPEGFKGRLLESINLEEISC